ncbi:hypothetical protein G6031_08675 [Dietzia sp. CQ4]|uniref:hypothetical protein n=1 Tax=Dietzia sp. (strain CQ4) TaxID=370437 RepID=UPI0015F86550|nr:hypothetical protein [Dietzia sp. CQ4]MBB1034462.1 hypothetical protein [Dietzia sp. CQ4]
MVLMVAPVASALDVAHERTSLWLSLHLGKTERIPVTTVRTHGILASSRPVEAYGGMQLAEETIEELAQVVRSGTIPVSIAHDSARPVSVSNVDSGTRRNDEGYLEAWVEFDVDETRWEAYQSAVRAAGIDGLGGMSITFMNPLDGEETVDTPVKVAGDAHHFTDDEIRAAAVLLRALDPSASGERLYQLSAVPALRVVFDLMLDSVMSIGASIAASAIYDAAKTLFKRGQTNSVDIAFKEAKSGARSLKIAIKYHTEEELKTAMDRLPAVVESGARGTFAHHADGYVQVDNDVSPAIDTADGTAEVEASEETSSPEDRKPPAE